MRKIVPKNPFFYMLSCQNTLNIIIFGWFALRIGNKNMKKIVIFAVYLKSLFKKKT